MDIDDAAIVVITRLSDFLSPMFLSMLDSLEVDKPKAAVKFMEQASLDDMTKTKLQVKKSPRWWRDCLRGFSVPPQHVGSASNPP